MHEGRAEVEADEAGDGVAEQTGVPLIDVFFQGRPDEQRLLRC